MRGRSIVVFSDEFLVSSQCVRSFITLAMYIPVTFDLSNARATDDLVHYLKLRNISDISMPGKVIVPRDALYQSRLEQPPLPPHLSGGADSDERGSDLVECVVP